MDWGLLIGAGGLAAAFYGVWQTWRIAKRAETESAEVKRLLEMLIAGQEKAGQLEVLRKSGRIVGMVYRGQLSGQASPASARLRGTYIPPHGSDTADDRRLG